MKLFQLIYHQIMRNKKSWFYILPHGCASIAPTWTVLRQTGSSGSLADAIAFAIALNVERPYRVSHFISRPRDPFPNLLADTKTAV